MSYDGKDGKRDGMGRAERHADPYWWSCMLEAGREAALRKPYLYTDDIVRWCKEHHPNASTHEPRAIGPLMRELCRTEVILPTQDWVQSTQAQCHRRPMQVWFSLSFRGGGHYPKPKRRRPHDPRQFDLVFGGAAE